MPAMILLPLGLNHKAYPLIIDLHKDITNPCSHAAYGTKAYYLCISRVEH